MGQVGMWSPPPPPPPTTTINNSLLLLHHVRHHQTVGLGMCCCSNNNNNNNNNKDINIKEEKEEENRSKRRRRRRVFFLDVSPLCYSGKTPSLRSFHHWTSLFFSQVTPQHDPVIAVLDGEGGTGYRRELLPSYKAHRGIFVRQIPTSAWSSKAVNGSVHHVIRDVFQKCNVPVVKVKGCEADDVVATLAEQALQSGFRVVIGSPDKDFKQLISHDVQMVIPMPELGRWSFYTLKHYIDQYKLDPSSDLSLRCILGDEVDGVPGIQHVAPGFGRKTALKLVKKHGSLENLLSATRIRTVGKPYVQDALAKHADYLRKNYEVLSLRKDVDIHLEDEWLHKRDACNDALALSELAKLLEAQKLKGQPRALLK